MLYEEFNMRLFTGIRINEDIRRNIDGVTQKLSHKIKEARIVLPENLHLTLKFMGEVEENRLEAVKNVLSGLCSGFEPFNLEIKGLGGFPDGKDIRVLWVGADSKGHLRSLNREIEKELELLGFPRENRFKEHITVARFKSTPNLSLISELKETYGDYLFGAMRAEGIELIQSILTGKSTIYRTLLKIPLGLSYGQ